MRTIVFGDIHGCIDPFAKLLEQIRPDPMVDRIILLGDLADRGPDSWAVWQKVMEIGEAFGNRFVLLRGNHETYWMQKQQDLRLHFLHQSVGKQETVRSFKKHRCDMDQYREWLWKNVRLFYRDSTLQCVHAAVMVEPIEDNDEYTLVHDHQLVKENRYQGRLTITGHISLKNPSWFTGDSETVIELEQEAWYPLQKKGILCLDTGCGKGGRLTAMEIEGDRFRLFSQNQN